MPQPPLDQIGFDPRVDYYGALGVQESAGPDEIKRSYRKLAKQLHPDSTGGDKAKESRFKEVQAAYEVLGDSKKRQLYDEIRHGWPSRGVYAREDLFDLSDLFGEFLRVPRSKYYPHHHKYPPPRVHVERVEFDGRTDDAEFESQVQASDGSWMRVQGSDVYSDVRVTFDEAILGTTAMIATVDGRAEIKIPPGTSSGKMLRLRGKGAIDRRARGDHYVTVQIDVPAEVDEEQKKLLAQFVRRRRRD